MLHGVFFSQGMESIENMQEKQSLLQRRKQNYCNAEKQNLLQYRRSNAKKYIILKF
jgi:hypothetical protein